MHELHMAIDDKFRSAGIEIAFPQQDVHLHGIAGAVANLAAAKPAQQSAAPRVVMSPTPTARSNQKRAS